MNIKNPISRSKKLSITRKIQTRKSKTHPYKFTYYDNHNRKITQKTTIDRINKLRIPPAYNNVTISENSNSEVQCIGEDDKGRKQYTYHPDFIKQKQDEKYEDVQILGEVLPTIKRDVQTKLNQIRHTSNLDSLPQPDSFIAIIIYLLDKHNIRIGNMKYANEYGSYGATTLRKRHFKTKNGVMYLEFIGKKGVVNKTIIDDTKMVSIFKKILNNCGASKNDDYIFKYISDYGNKRLVSTDDVSNYLKSFDEEIKPKMFRTWYGNYFFLEKIRNDIKNQEKYQLLQKLNKTQTKKYSKMCCEYIADRLHNTPAICKKSYLDNLLLDKLTNDTNQFITYLYKNRQVKTDDLLLKLIKHLRS